MMGPCLEMKVHWIAIQPYLHFGMRFGTYNYCYLEDAMSLAQHLAIATK